MAKIECPTCERDNFKSEQGMKSHHSRTHNQSIAGVEVVCEICGDSYREKRSRKGRTKYCSNECQSKKINLICDFCDEQYKVQRHRRDSSFCSKSCRDEYKKLITGEQHPLYNGGPSDRYKTSEWTSFSDRYKSWVGNCEYCDSDENLHLHHIEPMSAGGDFWDNEFIVLCKDCHFGDYIKWHPPQLEEYI